MSAASIPRPLPSLDGAAARYWKSLGERRIELPRCRPCARTIFPPRPFCPRCHGDDLCWENIAPTGRVYTFSVVRRATHPWFADKVPYVYALVELDGGLRLPSMIVDPPESVAIGLRVEPVFEPVDGDTTLLFFRLVGS